MKERHTFVALIVYFHMHLKINFGPEVFDYFNEKIPLSQETTLLQREPFLAILKQLSIARFK